VKKKRFSEEQITAVLKEADARVKVVDCRKHGISDATFYSWNAKYACATAGPAATSGSPMNSFDGELQRGAERCGLFALIPSYVWD